MYQNNIMTDPWHSLKHRHKAIISQTISSKFND